MRTMTCKQMGGVCDYKMTANTSKEMMDAGMEHIEESHPELAKKMKNMSAEENRKWNENFMKSWDAATNM